MKGDRETNEGRLGGSGRDFGDQQPNLWEVRNPIASSYLQKNEKIIYPKLQIFQISRKNRKWFF